MRFQEFSNPRGVTECVIQPSAILPMRVRASSEPPESACPLDSLSALLASQMGQGVWSGFGSMQMFEKAQELSVEGLVVLGPRVPEDMNILDHALASIG